MHEIYKQNIGERDHLVKVVYESVVGEIQSSLVKTVVCVFSI